MPVRTIVAPVDTRGMTRAALFLLGAVALGACQTQAQQSSNESNATSGYGGPGMQDPSSGSTATDTAPADASEPTTVVAIYGAPSPQ